MVLMVMSILIFNGLFMLKKTAKIVAEICVVIVIVVALTIAVTGYRLSKGPLDISFAVKTLENALVNDEDNINVKLDKAALYWPDLKGPLLLVLDNAIIEQDGKTLVELEKSAVSIGYGSLFLGKVRPKAVILTRPSLKIIRDENNEIKLAQNIGKREVKPQSNPKDAISIDDFIVQSLKMGKGSSDDPLFGIEAVEIKDATVFVEDYAQRKTWSINALDLLFLREKGRVEIKTALALLEGDEKNTLNSVFTLKPDDAYSVRTTFADIDPFLFAETLGLASIEQEGLGLNGDITVDLTQEGELQFLKALINIDEGQINLSDEYKEPLEFESLNTEFVINAKSNKASLDKFSLVAGDINITASGSGEITEDGLEFPLTFQANAVPVDAIDALWPVAKKQSSEREWIVEKISKGTITRAEAILPISLKFNQDISKEALPKDRWEISVGDPVATFALENTTVDYRAPLMPGENLTASGGYKDGTLTINIIDGLIGDLRVSDSTVVLDDIEVKGGGIANVEINGKGSLKTLLEYIKREPISLGDDIGFDTEQAKGDVDLNVLVSFPTIEDLKAEQVSVKVAAKINEAYLPDVVQGLTLTGGPYDLKAADGKIQLTGDGQLDGTPVKIDYQEYLEPKGAPYLQKVEASLVASRALRSKFGVALDEYIKGSLPVDITYTSKAGGKAKVDARANLLPVAFRIDPLDYLKPERINGTVTTSVYLTNDVVQEVDGLTIDLPDGKISGGRLIFGQVDGEQDVVQGSFQSIKLPENDFSLQLQRNEKGGLEFFVEGQKVDARPFLDSDSGDREIEVTEQKAGEEPPVIVSGTTNYLRLSDEGGVGKAKIYADIGSKGTIKQLEVDASVGVGLMQLRYRPDVYGVMNFTLDSADAGATLKALGVYENMKGGTIAIVGNAIKDGHPNDIEGKMQITNFNIVKAPGLARLLNAVSLSGLQELLSGQGMTFTKMASNFKYLKGDEGQTTITFEDGRTAGTEVGLTFEGAVYQTAGTIDIQGTIVPLSTINSFIGKIPLVGDILTGGGALFAATYKMQGPSKDAKVSINPLSALAPGIVRKILFEGESPAKDVE